MNAEDVKAALEKFDELFRDYNLDVSNEEFPAIKNEDENWTSTNQKTSYKQLTSDRTYTSTTQIIFNSSSTISTENGNSKEGNKTPETLETENVPGDIKNTASEEFNDMKSRTLLKDCRRARPKSKNRPPSQLFLKQVILNSNEEENDENNTDDENITQRNEEDQIPYSEEPHGVKNEIKLAPIVNSEKIINPVNSSENNLNVVEKLSECFKIDDPEMEEDTKPDTEAKSEKIKPVKYQLANMLSPAVLGEMKRTLTSKKNEDGSNTVTLTENMNILDTQEKPAWMQNLIRKKSFNKDAKVIVEQKASTWLDEIQNRRFKRKSESSSSCVTTVQTGEMEASSDGVHKIELSTENTYQSSTKETVACEKISFMEWKPRASQ